MSIINNILLLLSIAGIAAACTPPKQLEGILADATATKANKPGAKFNLLQLGIKYYLDSSLEKIRLDENVHNIKLTILQDYKQHKSYTVYNDAKCVTANLTQRFPYYPPSHSKFTGNFFLGGSNKNLLVKGFNFQYQNQTVSGFVDVENCIPVADSTYIQMPTQTVLSAIVFANFTTSISDLSVFKVPAICSQVATAKVEKFDPVHHARLRFADKHLDN